MRIGPGFWRSRDLAERRRTLSTRLLNNVVAGLPAGAVDIVVTNPTVRWPHRPERSLANLFVTELTRRSGWSATSEFRVGLPAWCDRNVRRPDCGHLAEQPLH